MVMRGPYYMVTDNGDFVPRRKSYKKARYKRYIERFYTEVKYHEQQTGGESRSKTD